MRHGYNFCNEMILSSIHADLAPKRHRSENSNAECDVMYMVSYTLVFLELIVILKIKTVQKMTTHT